MSRDLRLLPHSPLRSSITVRLSTREISANKGQNRVYGTARSRDANEEAQEGRFLGILESRSRHTSPGSCPFFIQIQLSKINCPLDLTIDSLFLSDGLDHSDRADESSFSSRTAVATTIFPPPGLICELTVS